MIWWEARGHKGEVDVGKVHPDVLTKDILGTVVPDAECMEVSEQHLPSPAF